MDLSTTYLGSVATAGQHEPAQVPRPWRVRTGQLHADSSELGNIRAEPNVGNLICGFEHPGMLAPEGS